MGSDSNISNSEIFKESNRNISDVLIPNNVILALYILLGVVGNGVVLYVYKVHFTRNLKERYFIPVLAATDLIACVVCGSFGILENILHTNLSNTYLCKVWSFLIFLSTFMSVMLLLIIAVQRYRKIVKPLGRQMDSKLNRIALLCAFLFSFVLACPTAFVYGTEYISSKNGSHIGMRCTINTEEYAVVSMIYSSLVGIITLIIIGSLIGIYFHIGWTIYKHVKFQRKNSNMTGTRKGTNGQLTPNMDLKPIKHENMNGEKYAPQTENAKESELPTQNSMDNRGKSADVGKPNQDHREKLNKKILHRFSLMFMLITIIFLICYIPTMTMIFLGALNTTEWDEFSDSARAALRFVYTMYIINNVSNPFVYAFLDTKFRKALIQMCYSRDK